eukprot:SAG31_NODE_2110_length_6426_cov_6.371898_1_plen_129_part_00
MSNRDSGTVLVVVAVTGHLGVGCQRGGAPRDHSWHPNHDPNGPMNVSMNETSLPAAAASQHHVDVGAATLGGLGIACIPFLVALIVFACWLGRRYHDDGEHAMGDTNATDRRQLAPGALFRTQIWDIL